MTRYSGHHLLGLHLHRVDESHLLGYELLEILAELIYHVSNKVFYLPRVTLLLVRLRFILKIDNLNIYHLRQIEGRNKRDQILQFGKKMTNLG